MSIKEKIKRTIQGIAQTSDGKEVCDPKPRLLRTGIKRKPTQEERFMRILNAHRQQMRENEAYADETDFDIEEDDMLTSYEKQSHVFDLLPEIPQNAQEPYNGSAVPTPQQEPQKPSGDEISSNDG